MALFALHQFVYKRMKEFD